MQLRSIRVRQHALDDMLAHARLDAPLECCGLLIGHDARVETTHRARNALASRTRFLVEPEDHFAAMRRARDMGLAVIGVYHSHPATAAIPSARDRDEVAYPEFIYLIVGLPEGVVEAYCLADGNFRPVDLVPVS